MTNKNGDDPTRFIVISGNKDGSLVPKEVFTSETVARQEAEVMASGNEGVQFHVYQKIGTAKLEPKVIWAATKPQQKDAA